ncbi:MAG: Gfo/Idh/MocA family oxidoreductase, partial [Bdellovibrionales bacterium]|nr:Gfo/Idh/MocA family oxidoreductase [Oligoflexia bacterium]
MSNPLKNKKIRYAVVGLGHLAQTAVLPAFKNARKNSELVALVSEDRFKLKKLGDQYGVQIRIHTSDYEALLASGQVDAVYLATPNVYHRDFAVMAARYGVHILCEKPLAIEEKDCQVMVDAAAKNKVKLMTAYRLHFDDANLDAVELAKSRKLGDLRIFNSIFTQQVKDQKNIRLDAEMGGGVLFDMGIYCINAARYLFQAEPVEVFAAASSSADKRFSEVGEMVTAVLKFPDNRLATFTASFGANAVASYELLGTKGNLRLEESYGYTGAMKLSVTLGEKTEFKKYPKRDQFAPELLYFSDCIQNNKIIEPSGEEG